MKVMLAAKATMDDVALPVYASPKIDGIRCHVEHFREGYAALTRTNKKVPNWHVQSLLGDEVFNGLDGEITVGDMKDDQLFRKTDSAVMTRDGRPDFRFNVFDLCSPTTKVQDFALRLSNMEVHLEELVKEYPFIVPVKHTLIETYDDLVKYEDECVSAGYEGIILRNPLSPYKEGRATLKRKELLKIKRFVDDEAEVIGFEELMHNDNEQERDELGYAKRSSAKAGLRSGGKLGALVVRWHGKEFKIGTGFTDHLRECYWRTRFTLLGRTVKFKFFPIGDYDVPRFPTFIGFRSQDDMGEPDADN